MGFSLSLVRDDFQGKFMSSRLVPENVPGGNAAGPATSSERRHEADRLPAIT
jgi:hypothetical protein